MLNFNPVYHFRHAWDGTKTVWGKVAIIVFYLYIWLNIIPSVWAYFAPRSLGMQCVLDSMDELSRSFFVATSQAWNAAFVGLLLYADVGGITVKNVAMAAVFTTFTFAPMILLALNTMQLHHDDPTSCLSASVAPYLWTMGSNIVLTWLTVVLALLEKRVGTHPSTHAERLPLNT